MIYLISQLLVSTRKILLLDILFILQKDIKDDSFVESVLFCNILNLGDGVTESQTAMQCRGSLLCVALFDDVCVATVLLPAHFFSYLLSLACTHSVRKLW